MARILCLGFGCRVLATDRYEDHRAEGDGVDYAGIDELIARSDIISLHCPLTPETHHLIDAQRSPACKPA